MRVYWGKTLCIAGLMASSAFGATITLVSGNGSVGGNDSQITFIAGPNNADFSQTLGPSDFAAAQSGSAAFIVAPGIWAQFTSGISGAQWIGTNANANGFSPGGNTGLYAISFNLANPVSSATFSMDYSADDMLGGPNNYPVYINGYGIGSPGATGGLAQTFNLSSSNIASFLNVGTNWLYIDAVQSQFAGPGGLLFKATITTVDEETPTSGTPEPGTWASLMGGLAGVAFAVKARRN